MIIHNTPNDWFNEYKIIANGIKTKDLIEIVNYLQCEWVYNGIDKENHLYLKNPTYLVCIDKVKKTITIYQPSNNLQRCLEDRVDAIDLSDKVKDNE